jgi:hypothetical protein
VESVEAVCILGVLDRLDANILCLLHLVRMRRLWLSKTSYQMLCAIIGTSCVLKTLLGLVLLCFYRVDNILGSVCVQMIATVLFLVRIVVSRGLVF